jgi:hypothetical protein
MPNVEKIVMLVREDLRQYKQDNKKVTREVIRKFVDNYVSFPIFKLTDEEYSKTIMEIESISQITLNGGTKLISNEHKPWLYNRKSEINFDYWNRYRQYLFQYRKFPDSVLNVLDNDLDDILDNCGDPKREEFYIKGLVMGDVQSGKTANYMGLVSKAADSGYKVIIILTGTIEKLRKQTQLRFDEGFVGEPSVNVIKNSKGIQHIGVGEIDPRLSVNVFTSTGTDFRKNTADAVNVRINNLNYPILFVMKKNVTILKRLIDWLKSKNLQYQQSQINAPVLIIDDEADNASINTKKPEDDPAKTNELIRELTSLFMRSSYVGYTATPFANIFIDPKEDEDMLNQDLFPKDFIYLLESPTNYIGSDCIFGDDPTHSNLLRVIDDAEDIIPLKHKKDLMLRKLPKSMEDAVLAFALSNTIKSLDGLSDKHSTMLINASRFNDVQERIKDCVIDFWRSLTNKLNLYSHGSMSNFTRYELGNRLYSVWISEYANIVNHDWINVQHALYISNAPVQIKIMNQKKVNTFSYEDYPDHGLKVIAIGGLSLSRGLTLEGLTISYFYRNSKLYDALMQMGRWFGYRPNYDHLCRLWMSEDTIKWYEEITSATNELKDLLKEMRSKNLTPKDFGLRIRNDQTALKITSYAKMRSAKEVVRKIKMGEDVFEVTLLRDNIKILDSNYQSLTNLITKYDFINPFEKYSSTTNRMVKNIKKSDIITFIKDFTTHINNTSFNKLAILEFIENYSGNELDFWDLVFIEGDGKKSTYKEMSLTINPTLRKLQYNNVDKVFQISGSKNRLGGPSDGKHGLTIEEIKLIEEKKRYEKKIGSNEKINLTQKDYFKYGVRKKPMLMIYLFEPSEKIDTITMKRIGLLDDVRFVSYGIGFPKLSKEVEQYARYKVNLVELRKHYEEEFGDDDDE